MCPAALFSFSNVSAKLVASWGRQVAAIGDSSQVPHQYSSVSFPASQEGTCFVDVFTITGKMSGSARVRLGLRIIDLGFMEMPPPALRILLQSYL